MKLAFYWYFQVAESGYSTAQFNLAEFYYNGIGTAFT
jgi:TPR repeat protein